MGVSGPGDAAELVRRIQAGEREAEGELVARYGPGLSYLLRHLTGDPDRAQDLRQETFLIALEKLRAGELREADKLPAFLRGTAKNLVRAGWRRERRRSRAGERPAPADDAEGPAAEPPDPAPGPLEGLLLEEEIGLARQLLAELASPRDREVLFRFCVAEEDKEAICSRLGLTRLQLNLVLFRARQRFRALWEAATREARGRGRGDSRNSAAARDTDVIGGAGLRRTGPGPRARG